MKEIVLIEVRGGVAEVTAQPESVSVLIVDHDVACDMVCPFCYTEREGDHDAECENMHPACHRLYDGIVHGRIKSVDWW